MEKLCFDLKLETLEQMGPRDVYELAKVNQGFRGMLVRDPSIVFGEHVCWIGFCKKEIGIEKFSDSNQIRLNVDRLFFHLPFVKKIRSCDDLSFWEPHRFNENTLLKNLKLVNHLYMEWNSKEALERFFADFHASIKKKARLVIYDSAFNDPMMKDRFENFMVAPQLKDCEMITLVCNSGDSVRFCYDALLKAEIKNVVMRTASWSVALADLLIQQIITNGIPSKNPEAAFCLDTESFDLDLSQYPGMRRIDGENHFRLLKQANYLARNCGYDGSNFFMKESSIFRRRFDLTKDCIYVYDERYARRLLAYCVPVD